MPTIDPFEIPQSYTSDTSDTSGSSSNKTPETTNQGDKKEGEETKKAPAIGPQEGWSEELKPPPPQE